MKKLLGLSFLAAVLSWSGITGFREASLRSKGEPTPGKALMDAMLDQKISLYDPLVIRNAVAVSDELDKDYIYDGRLILNGLLVSNADPAFRTYGSHMEVNTEGILQTPLEGYSPQGPIVGAEINLTLALDSTKTSNYLEEQTGMKSPEGEAYCSLTTIENSVQGYTSISIGVSPLDPTNVDPKTIGAISINNYNATGIIEGYVQTNNGDLIDLPSKDAEEIFDEMKDLCR